MWKNRDGCGNLHGWREGRHGIWLLLFGIRVDAINFDHRRALGQISGNNNLKANRSEKQTIERIHNTYRNGHQLANVLDLVSG